MAESSPQESSQFGLNYRNPLLLPRGERDTPCRRLPLRIRRRMVYLLSRNILQIQRITYYLASPSEHGHHYYGGYRCDLLQHVGELSCRIIFRYGELLYVLWQCLSPIFELRHDHWCERQPITCCAVHRRLRELYRILPLFCAYHTPLCMLELYSFDIQAPSTANWFPRVLGSTCVPDIHVAPEFMYCVLRVACVS